MFISASSWLLILMILFLSFVFLDFFIVGPFQLQVFVIDGVWTSYRIFYWKFINMIVGGSVSAMDISGPTCFRNQPNPQCVWRFCRAPKYEFKYLTAFGCTKSMGFQLRIPNVFSVPRGSRSSVKPMKVRIFSLSLFKILCTFYVWLYFVGCLHRLSKTRAWKYCKLSRSCIHVRLLPFFTSPE